MVKNKGKGRIRASLDTKNREISEILDHALSHDARTCSCKNVAYEEPFPDQKPHPFTGSIQAEDRHLQEFLHIASENPREHWRLKNSLLITLPGRTSTIVISNVFDAQAAKMSSKYSSSGQLRMNDIKAALIELAAKAKTLSKNAGTTGVSTPTIVAACWSALMSPVFAFSVTGSQEQVWEDHLRRKKTFHAAGDFNEVMLQSLGNCAEWSLWKDLDKGTYHTLAMAVAKKMEYKPACGNCITLAGRLERFAGVFLQDMATVVDEGLPSRMQEGGKYLGKGTVRDRSNNQSQKTDIPLTGSGQAGAMNQMYWEDILAQRQGATATNVNYPQYDDAPQGGVDEDNYYLQYAGAPQDGVDEDNFYLQHAEVPQGGMVEHDNYSQASSSPTITSGMQGAENLQEAEEEWFSLRVAREYPVQPEWLNSHPSRRQGGTLSNPSYYYYPKGI